MIFIDTGAFISKYIENDQYHNKSLTVWDKIIGKSELYTSNHIIDEIITFLMRNTTPSFTIEKANLLYQTDVYKILHSDIEEELHALRILEKYQDQDLSFTDCLTVSLMKRHNIKEIFTFDRHFKLFGLNLIGLQGKG